MAKGNKIRAIGENAGSSTLSEAGEANAAATQAGPVFAADDGEEADETYADAWVERDEYTHDAYEEEAAYGSGQSRFGWIAPAIAIALIAGWSALYAFAMRSALMNAADASPAEWVSWIIDWSVPVLLVCVGWLLTMRHSRAEAKRFAQTASLLSQESRELETRLTVVNRELSMAREFLGAQSRELESLGRIASERLSTHASELQSLIHDNGAQVAAIGSASETALGNMTRLRDDLPVVANSARDLSNKVGNAGRTAQDNLEKLISGFERLNQFGKASENQVSAFDTRVRDSLSGFEGQVAEIGALIGARLEQVQERTASLRAEVGDVEDSAISALNDRLITLQAEAQMASVNLREAEVAAMEQLGQSRARFEQDVTKTVESLDRLDRHAISASRKRVEELNAEANRFDERLAVRDRRFIEEMTKRQETFETRETQGAELLSQRLAALDEAMAERREAQMAETERLVAQSTAMGEQLNQLTALISDISAQSTSTREGVSASFADLGRQLADKQEALAETEAKLAGLTEAGVRLLEIIQSGAKHAREDLPRAIGAASDTLGSVEARAEALSTLMFATNDKASNLGDYLIDTQAKIEGADSSIEALSAKLGEHSEDALAKLQGLRGGFTRLSKDSEAYAGETQGALRAALGELETATSTAFATLEEGARERVSGLAHSISEQAVRDIERALRRDTAEATGQIEQAAAHASGVGREAAVQLRDQLAKLNELTVNLEQRISHAREKAEERVDNDFARRMAMITDTLNSSAIDIDAALARDVSDTAWESYLKGDRGIFTRRAVRLIDNGEARDIAELYQRDDGFKALVNRYVHDFEAMLRSMLSTRNGNALSVTILGSDIGKLYVILAQGIERLRQ